MEKKEKSERRGRMRKKKEEEGDREGWGLFLNPIECKQYDEHFHIGQLKAISMKKYYSFPIISKGNS